MMHTTITRRQLATATRILEDSVSFICDTELMSGQTCWAIVEALAIAKSAELQGLTSDR